MELAHRTKKPIVVLKGGKSFAGCESRAQPHVEPGRQRPGSRTAFAGIAGVTVAHDFQQMMEIAQALAMIPDTPSLCRTAVMTFSGGAGILSCDLLEEQGLVIAELTPETKKELGAIFPDWLPASNPVDLFPAFGAKGPLAAYQGAFAALLKDPGVDVIFMHYFAGLIPASMGSGR